MIIAATNRTPEIIFSASGCTVKGECYPEDITELSKPVMKKLAKDLAQSDAYSINIELHYFNSSSAKFLFDVFEFLDNAASQGKEIEVTWFYRQDDDSMEEAGGEFQEDIKNVLFKLAMLN